MPYYQDTQQTQPGQAKILERCAGCDFELPDDDGIEICPYCGAANEHYDDGWRDCDYCDNHYHKAEADGDCPYCGNHAADYGDDSALQRARAIIRWYGPMRRRTLVNRLLLRYWEQVRHAKELKLRGYSERATAEIQGVSKTAVHHRLQKPFSLMRSEITRITRWLTGPEPIRITQCIGIDHRPATATVIDRYKAIRTRYGWLCYLDRQESHQQRRE